MTHSSGDGKLLDRVGTVKDIGGCVRVTVGVNQHASRVYLLEPDQERRPHPQPAALVAPSDHADWSSLI